MLDKVLSSIPQFYFHPVDLNGSNASRMPGRTDLHIIKQGNDEAIRSTHPRRFLQTPGKPRVQLQRELRKDGD
ncbi:hypothetical protein SUGI_0034500 [Cryptomeria japonica]|nr:hypothetical protein SUGI_0034500 [Cryptomeria japonica]